MVIMEKIKNRLRLINLCIKQMECDLNYAKAAIENFEGYDDLFSMENKFSDIKRQAEQAEDMVMNTYDLLEEE